MSARTAFRPMLVAATFTAGALVPGHTAAQVCGPTGLAVGGSVAAVRYDMAGGVSGTEVDARLRGSAGSLGIEVAYGRLLLQQGVADPNVARVTVRAPLASLLGLHFCFAGHGATSWFSANGDDGRVLAGGVGLVARLPLPLGGVRLTPFVEGRALAAHSSGSILGLDASATGESLGGEAGADLVLGHLLVRGGAAFDGLAGGLGATPYPTHAFRIEAVYRF